MFIKNRCWLFFLFLTGMPSPLFATASPVTFPWLAYGDLRGYLEPCGCDPATDMGGVKRIMGLLQRERLAVPTLFAFDLGNMLPVKEAEAALKTTFLLEAGSNFKPTSALFNELEMKHRRLITQNLEKNTRSLPPYTLSNLTAQGQAELPFVVPKIATPAAQVFGYLWLNEPGDAQGFLQRIDPTLLATWKREIAKQKNLPAILLFSGPTTHLKTIVASQLFSEIISSNAAPLSTSPGTAERFDEKKLLRLKAEKTIHMVPIGGQGVLRGGTLRRGEAKSLNELLTEKNIPSMDLGRTPTPEKQLFRPDVLVTWLEPKKFEEGALANLFVRYNEAAASLFKSNIAKRAKDLATSPYVGAEACAACHPKAYATWKKSKHAQAMATLQAKAKDQDSECVACHVVGANAIGGFVSMELSAHLADVQCENCHGPRREHAGAPKGGTSTRATGICVGCHNPTHSPLFDFKRYWQRIEHSKE